MNDLSLQEAEFVSYTFVQEMMHSGEPMPPFSTRLPGKLESCLAQPFATFDGKELYPTVEMKCAVLFYFVIKNHPFHNGNKRMAVTLLMTFLFKNNLWMDIGTMQLYNLANVVGAHNSREWQLHIDALTKVFARFIRDIDPSELETPPADLA